MITKFDLSNHDDDLDFEDLGFTRDEVDTLVSLDLKECKSQSSSIRTDRLALEKEAEMAMERMKLLLSSTIGTLSIADSRSLRTLTSKLSTMHNEIMKSKESSRSLRKFYRERSAAESFKAKEIEKVMKAVCAAEFVDLAFVIDCTSSMSPHIISVKQTVKIIVRNILKTNKSLSLRLAAVAHRDIRDKNRFEIFDFNKSIKLFESFLGRLEAIGGDDGPEDLAGAIKETNKLSWSHPTSVTFIIADYPCHGREYHNNMFDNYPNGTTGIDVVQELKALQGKQTEDSSMSVHFGRITHHTDTMIEHLRSKDNISIDVVPVDDIPNMIQSVSSSVRKSIYKTVSVSQDFRGARSHALRSRPLVVDRIVEHDDNRDMRSANPRKRDLKKFTIVESAPSTSQWSCIKACEVNVFTNADIKSLEALKSPLRYGRLCPKQGIQSESSTQHSAVYIRRVVNPFAQGESRIAYYGQLAREVHELSKNVVVCKSFKHNGDGIHDRDRYLKQMEVSNVSHYLAKEYNKAKKNNCAEIHIIPVCVVEEESASSERNGERRFCAEALLPQGTFQKFSNNTGY